MAQQNNTSVKTVSMNEAEFWKKIEQNTVVVIMISFKTSSSSFKKMDQNTFLASVLAVKIFFLLLS